MRYAWAMERERKLDANTKQRIVGSIRAGLSYQSAAALYDISPRAVRNERKKDWAFDLACKNARSALEQALVDRILDPSNPWQAVAWYLERTGGERYKLNKRTDATEQPPTQVVIVKSRHAGGTDAV